ncbi:MAG: hypothetical protein ACI9UT_001675 [Flavobacteriales bacterium]|jgi:hypothetical protein
MGYNFLFNVHCLTKYLLSGRQSMSKPIKLISALVLSVVIALIVYVAGELALSNSPLAALVPVGVLLAIIVVYIRIKDKQD